MSGKLPKIRKMDGRKNHAEALKEYRAQFEGNEGLQIALMKRLQKLDEAHDRKRAREEARKAARTKKKAS